MNISKNIREDLTTVITLNMVEDDYKAQVEQELKKYRAKATLKGFRTGKAPMGLIKKLVGNTILVQEIDKLVSRSLSDYMQKEKMEIIGQPLPVKDQAPLDLDNKKDFSFAFEVGVEPEFELKIDENIQVPFYTIKASEKELDEHTKKVLDNFGKMEDIDQITEKSYIKANLLQSSAENVTDPEGISIEDTHMAVDLIKDEEIKKVFLGKKVNDVFTVDLAKAYPNETELSSLLNIEKDKVSDIDPHFEITVNKISEFKPAELNQEVFDQIYEKDTVKTEEEFRAKEKEKLEKLYVDQSYYLFKEDIREILLEQADMKLPDTFLKRFLLEGKNNEEQEELSKEEIEKHYVPFSKNLEWSLVKNKIFKEQKFEIEDEDIEEEAIAHTYYKLTRYGIDVDKLDSETLDSIVDEELGKHDNHRIFLESAIEKKIVAFIKEKVKVEEKEISSDEVKEIYKKKLEDTQKSE